MSKTKKYGQLGPKEKWTHYRCYCWLCEKERARLWKVKERERIKDFLKEKIEAEYGSE